MRVYQWYLVPQEDWIYSELPVFLFLQGLLQTFHYQLLRKLPRLPLIDNHELPGAEELG